MPLISVITPAHNASATLAATIASVRAQTMHTHAGQDWEMIIVDDYSDDSTIALAARCAEDDPRIRVIRSAENTGSTRARNKALAAANGRYIAFLNAYDVWLPQKLQLQIEFMQRHNYAISCTAFRRFRDDINAPSRIITFPTHITFDTLLKRAPIALSSIIIDTQRTGAIAFDETLDAYEELALWLNMTREGFDIHFMPEDLLRQKHSTDNRILHTIRSLGWLWEVYRQVGHLSTADANKAVLRRIGQNTLRRFWPF